MAYAPNEQDAIGAYIAVVAHRHNLSVPEVDWPILDDVKESLSGSFTIRAGGNDIVVAMYDESKDLWIVRLENGAHVKVRKTSQGDSFVFIVE